LVAQNSIPQEIASTPLNSSKRKRRPSAKTPTPSPSPKRVPKDMAKSTISVPPFTVTEAKKQTTPKTDGNFEAVFSRLIGDAPVRRTEKNPHSV